MTTLHDSGPQELLSGPNYAVVSTHNKDASIHSTIVWISDEGGSVAVNSAIGRLYPYRRPGEQRIKFVIEPDHVRYVKQG
jgi:hypothetical protein